MFTGHMQCPRCKRANWHRDELTPLRTGVQQTELICTTCAEKLLVRSWKENPQKGLIVNRWSKCKLGKMKPKYFCWPTWPSGYEPAYKEGS